MIIGGRVTRVGGSGSGSCSSASSINNSSTYPAINNSSSGSLISDIDSLNSESFLGLPILYWLIIAVIVIAGGILVYVFA